MAAPALTSIAEIRLPEWLAAMPLPAPPVADEACMRFAIAAARENVARGGGPFGACLRSDLDGAVIAVGANLVTATGNPVLHAETVAILLAGPRLADGATLFTSCEPCIMCLGASHWAQVRRIVSAALKADAEAAGFSEGAGTLDLRAEMAARNVRFDDGYLRDEGAAVLRLYVEHGLPIYGPRN